MQTYDASNFDNALKSKNMVVALFCMETCPFCQRFEPIFNRHRGNSGMDFIKVDITDENSPLWDRYGIEYVPAIIIFRQGKPVLHMDARPGEGLKESDLEGAIAKAMNK